MDAQNHLPLTDLFASLTDAQREAVAHIDGPMLTLAGPGSGKTRVVTHRIANLLRHGIQPRNILALTFANKAADEQIFGQLVDLSDMPAFDAAVKTVLDTQQYAFSMPASPAGAEFEQAWRAAVDAVVSGGDDPAQALADADAEAQSALDAAGR